MTPIPAVVVTEKVDSNINIVCEPYYTTNINAHCDIEFNSGTDLTLEIDYDDGSPPQIFDVSCNLLFYFY
jgi:hypothetical protein